MRDKPRGKRRARIGLLIGTMALLGAILVPGGAASSAPVRGEVGVLRLHLDADGKYFRFDTRAGASYTQGTPQSINGSCPVTSLSGPSWVNLTGGSTSFTLNQVGLKDNGLGVRFLNCGRVDAPNWALRLKLGTGIDAPGVGIDRAELDLQGFSNATAVADLFLDGTKVDTVTQAITGSGTRARMVIDRTGKSIFDEIRLHPKNVLSSLALRGGGAGSPVASTLGSALGTNDTLFRVVSERLPGPPATLTFVTQPTDTLVNDCINNLGCSSNGSVKVEVKDADGKPVADGTNVTMSIGVDPTKTATLSGTLSAMTSGGIATFSNLKINKTSSGYKLQADAEPASGPSNEFAITNTDSSCTDDCTATFPNGTSTVSAPAGTVLIIETNQLTCVNVGNNFLAGTVKIVPPPGPDAIDVTFQDFFGPMPLPPVNFQGPFPFCKTFVDPVTLEETAHDVPLCSEVDGAVPCVTETVEFTGPNTATLTSVLHMDSTDPHAKH